MFRGLINEATSAAAGVATKYAMRATIAVPFLIALVFALIGSTIMLADAYGIVVAAWAMAVAFTIVGLIAATMINHIEQEAAVSTLASEKTDTQEVASEATVQAIEQAPWVILSDLVTTVGGPATVIGAGRVIGRNLPLVAFVGAIGLLLLSDRNHHSR